MRQFLATLALSLIALSVRADQLLPTAEGTTWEYDSTEIITGTAPVRSVVTVRAGKQVLNDKEVVKFETLSGNVVSKTELMAVDDRGLVRLGRTGKEGKLIKLDPPETIVAMPLRVGTMWSQESEVAGIRMHQVWRIVAEEGVTVPAQRFQAFHLQCEDASLISIKLDKWFVPGTGFVKEVTRVKGPGMLQVVTLELRKLPAAVATPAPTPSPAPTTAPEKQPEAAPSLVPAPSPSPSAAPVETATQPGTQPATPAKMLAVEVSDDSAGGSMKTEFKSNVANIYVRWLGHGLPDGAMVRVAWIAEDVGDLVEPNFIVDETETIALRPDAGARFTLGRPPDGWAEGKYRVEFYVNDILIETVRVNIGQ